MTSQKAIFSAFSCGLFIVCFQFAAGTAKAQKASDPRVADIVRAGKFGESRIER